MTNRAKSVRRILSGIMLLVLAAVAQPSAARAEIASAWQYNLGSQARLIAGQASGHGDDLFAGIEIRLEKGWKTYWRSPGDTGIPPMFDWSKSQNIESADVLFPVPSRISDPAGMVVGYKGAVVFPVRVRAGNAGAPVKISLSLDYAACSELCVPVHADLELTLPASSTVGLSGRIGDYLKRVPQPAGEGDNEPRIQSVSVEGSGKEREIVISVLQPSGATSPDLFVEGPPDWYLPQAKLREERPAGDGEELVYAVPLHAIRPQIEVAGNSLRLTVVNSNIAVEREWTLH